MHLEHHAEREVLVVDAFLDADHGNLDEVGGAALHGGVYGHAFGHLRFHAVGAVDACDVAAAAGKRFDIAVAVGGGLGVVDELLYALVHFEVAVDKALGLCHRDFQVAGEAEGGHAVEHAEVHDLRVAAHVGGHVFEAYAVDGGGRAGVDVDAFLVAFDERFVSAQVGEHAELNLRVVYRENHVVRILRNECGADLLAEIATDGDVLQVRVAAREAACCCTPLDEACVDALRVRVHERREHGNVGALHLLEFSVLDNGENNRVRAAEAEFFEDGGVGAAFFDFGESECVKEHFAELLGRADVKFATCHVADFFFELFDAVFQIGLQFLENLRVDECANAFHLVKHLEKRHFLAEEVLLVVVLLELGAERSPEAERVDGVFGAVFGRVLDGCAVERDLVLAASDEVLDRNHLVLQKLHHLIVEAEPGLAGREHPCGDERIDDVCGINLLLRESKGAGENVQVEFGIMENE